MKKLIKVIYLVFTAFLFACTNIENKEQINRATAVNTEFTINNEEKTTEELGFNTNLEKAQEITKDEEKHLNANLHTDLANKDEREKLKTAGEKLSNVAEALTSSNKTLGNFSERYTQAALAGGMADTIIENQDRLSILEKTAKKDGVIDEDIIKEKAGALLNTLEDTLAKFGYKGKEVKVVITDVVDPNGNTFTSTKENIIVFDREFLATATKDELIGRIAHEFGHYTEADNETKSQKAAEYFSGLVMEKVKGVSSKEATDETYTRIRNNKNVIIGEEGKKLAENIPMNDREYKVYLMERDLDTVYSVNDISFNYLKGAGHTSIIMIPDNQKDFFENGKLKEKYENAEYPKPIEFQGKLGWTLGGFNGEKVKREENGKLVVRFNDVADVEIFRKNIGEKSNTLLSGDIISEIESDKMSDSNMINELIRVSQNYSNNSKKVEYYVLPILNVPYSRGGDTYKSYGYNCNSFSSTILKEIGIASKYHNFTSKRITTGKNSKIPSEYFKTRGDN